MVKRRNDSTEIAYFRIRRNAQAILRDAKKDGIDVSDLEPMIPLIPKEITEGSIRRITKVHAAIKKEVARRRRLKRYSMYKSPGNVSSKALDDLKAKIQTAINWVEDEVIGWHDGKRKVISATYKKMIRKSGRKANDIMQSLINRAKRKAEKMHPRPTSGGTITRSQWIENMAKIILIKTAEKILREYEEKVEHFLFGYGDPGDISYDKPTDLLLFVKVMDEEVTPELLEELFSDVHNQPEYDVYE